MLMYLLLELRFEYNIIQSAFRAIHQSGSNNIHSYRLYAVLHIAHTKLRYRDVPRSYSDKSMALAQITVSLYL